MNNRKFINNLSDEGAKKLLLELMNWLDSFQDDEFGTEGWRHAIGWDD